MRHMRLQVENELFAYYKAIIIITTCNIRYAWDVEVELKFFLLKLNFFNNFLK
jgi:hypothetical protein